MKKCVYKKSVNGLIYKNVELKLILCIKKPFCLFDVFICL